MINVLSLGMSKSGSTVLYNIIRLIWSHKFGDNEVYGCYYPEYKKEKFAKYNVVKCHNMIPLFKSEGRFIFDSVRDIRDIAASHRLRGKSIEQIYKKLQRIAKRYNKVSKRTMYTMIYTNMMNDCKQEIVNVSKKLNIQLTNDDIDIIHKNLMSTDFHTSGGENNIKHNFKHNDLTLFHKNHIINGGNNYYKEVLDDEMIKNIESDYPALCINGI